LPVVFVTVQLISEPTNVLPGMNSMLLEL